MASAEAVKSPEAYVEYLRETHTGSRDYTVSCPPPLGGKDPLEIEVEVFPGVFTPTTDTRLMARNLPRYVYPGSRVLDMTTGSGVLAVAAAALGACGVAADINPAAVKNAQHNFERHNAPFEAVESDVFGNVPDDEFDIIMATPPYLDGSCQDPLDYAIHGTSHFVSRLFRGARRHLAPDGKILVTYAEWGKVGMFKRALGKYAMDWGVIGSANSTDGERRYNLYEVRPAA